MLESLLISSSKVTCFWVFSKKIFIFSANVIDSYSSYSSISVTGFISKSAHHGATYFPFCKPANFS